MQVFVIAFAALVASVSARPGFLGTHFYGAPAFAAYSAPAIAYSAVTPVEVSNQYHAQDALGQYSYGYSSGSASKAEQRSIDGITSGAYSYVDGNGAVQNVQYTADAAHGFRVAATNLPVAPEVPEVPAVEAPKPVEDTAEVAEAKSAHLAAVEEAKTRNAAVAAADTVEASIVHTVHTVPLAYSSPVVSVPYAAAPVGSFAYSYNTIQGANPYYATYAHLPTHYASYPGFAHFGLASAAPAVAIQSVAPAAAVAIDSSDDTVEIAAAREAHTAAHVEAKARLAAAGGEVN